MKKLMVAFDVDDCLIVPSVATGFDTDTPNYETINIFKWFQAQGCFMICWSGGGAKYAEQWANKLGITADAYLDKDSNMKDRVDIAFDDCDVELAKANVKVKRTNNGISRSSWNAHPHLCATCGDVNVLAEGNECTYCNVGPLPSSPTTITNA